MKRRQHSPLRRIPRVLWELGRTWWVYPGMTVEDVITDARLAHLDILPPGSEENIGLEDDKIIDGLRKLRGVR